MSSNENENYLYIPHAGPNLIETPLLNKGSAFTERERKAFNLLGLLPPRYESIDEQVTRAYKQYKSFSSPLNKHIYLRAIQDNNETLFYRLIKAHIDEMMPIIYTPTVGEACERFSDIYRSSRGLFVSYDERYMMKDILRNATKRKVKVIVVTDGERVLGLGDQGIGGMGIPIGKLSLYTACGGISPAYTLPVMLDVGTNNVALQQDPMYMGARHPRITDEQYYDFIDTFISESIKRWPDVLIQFEDFAQPNAMPLLEKYRHHVCCFNDDIQGTAAVTLGTLLAACKSQKKQLSSVNVVIAGAGSAGCGIASMIVQQMVREGLDVAQARDHIFMVDKDGLLSAEAEDLRDFQKPLATKQADIAAWQYAADNPSLIETIDNAKPSILIGVSGQFGLFNQDVVATMQKRCPHPIIFPLSNPSKQAEATPEQIIDWTNGNVTIATGSPFAPVSYNGKTMRIAQCNNSYIFPGIGLGVIASKAKKVTDEMLMAASEALANASPAILGTNDDLLPSLGDIENLSRSIALAVANCAIAQEVALQVDEETLKQRIEKEVWQPQYRPYKRISM